ncbi:GDP-Fuc:beta-D-Gal-1,3-alpha-D-GalNAc-1, 3-alpha-GalNAc-diphosphoundecaprenol alpha-1,2-fucosyltransferase [Patescibacteria group bacterium]|nr:GDP-Fuc:beta-D-Gal-1,3-alpha-D-GalNAc-1, 3-alpha-GalNAc-diphosphoundecaprenol alpha-1,2-fucosyltransferase [Patescibacteria group bacterium]
MIIVNIIGGLGNQMFQYAAGRALSIARNEILLLDIGDFSGYGLHQGFELQRLFDCSIHIASRQAIKSVLGWQAYPLLKRGLTRQYGSIFRKSCFVIEPYFEYWSGFRDLSNNVYLQGYWQSERYFENIADVIRGDFVFKLPMNAINIDVSEKIASVNSVSLHIRRGDYVSNPVNLTIHGLCRLDYYQSAIDLIVSKVSQPHFFVFSDDIVWAKTNLKFDFAVDYISHNVGTESYNDMRLMSLCQHHIIANSSFSWWGAWLNQNPNKIVIAPKRWFVVSKNISDLLPDSWIVL